MSCYGWGVGDECLVMQTFRVAVKQMNGPNLAKTIEEGDRGVVKEIIDQHPNHLLFIRWNRLNETLFVPEEDFKYLKNLSNTY